MSVSLKKTCFACAVVALPIVAVGLFMPHGHPIGDPEENRTKVGIKILILATKQYESQYGVLPATADAERPLSAAEYDAFIDLLVGNNGRGIRFLEPSDPKKLTYLDPNKQRFQVILDVNYDGKIIDEQGVTRQANMLTWSLGENPDDSVDDVRSWD